MKHYRKLVIAVSILFTLALVLSACASTEVPNSSRGVPDCTKESYSGDGSIECVVWADDKFEMAIRLNGEPPLSGLALWRKFPSELIVLMDVQGWPRDGESNTYNSTNTDKNLSVSVENRGGKYYISINVDKGYQPTDYTCVAKVGEFASGWARIWSDGDSGVGLSVGSTMDGRNVIDLVGYTFAQRDSEFTIARVDQLPTGQVQTLTDPKGGLAAEIEQCGGGIVRYVTQVKDGYSLFPRP